MQGYSYSLPKHLFLFLNTDLYFHWLLVVTQFMYSLIKSTVQKGAQPSQNKQVLIVCVALWRHTTSSGSKHDAAILTDYQDVPQTLLMEIRCYISAILVISDKKS